MLFLLNWRRHLLRRCGRQRRLGAFLLRLRIGVRGLGWNCSWPRTCRRRLGGRGRFAVRARGGLQRLRRLRHCGWPALRWVSERPATTSPAATNEPARSISFLKVRFLSSGFMICPPWFAGSTDAEHIVPAGTGRRKARYSSSSPASPSSAANASSVPLPFHASAATGAAPRRRTRISAPSVSRTIRMVPSL